MKMKLIVSLFLATTLSLWLAEGDGAPIVCNKDRASTWNRQHHVEPNDFTAAAIDTLRATKQALDSVGVPFFIASGLYCAYIHTYIHTHIYILHTVRTHTHIRYLQYQSCTHMHTRLHCPARRDSSGMAPQLHAHPVGQRCRRRGLDQ